MNFELRTVRTLLSGNMKRWLCELYMNETVWGASQGEKVSVLVYCFQEATDYPFIGDFLDRILSFSKICTRKVSRHFQPAVFWS
jgi:hypothetical protein